MSSIQEKSRDPLDRLFEWAEVTMCPASMGNNYKPEPMEDTLDYVFEHVESFTCRAEEDGKEYDTLETEINMERGNSLVEANEKGQPVVVETTRPKVKPLGQEGDLVDYVFEHVESFVCNESMPDDHTKPISAVTPSPQRSQSRPETVFEPEDEIQLYFRPQRRRRNKGENRAEC
eukprot:Nitzschia sp. Nitz4//scaffold84_size84139//56926//57653//NITZ4_005205-RA/size84139-snap-gene-0.122-mRNA-1//-1//CDS//3329559054//2239//frame0